MAQVAEHPNRSGLVDEAYAAIRARILDGRIPPGSRVTVRPLADKLDLSATPIKGALVALEREGIISSRLHKGFFVPELGADDMREIYDMREALDVVSAERAAASVTATRARKLLNFCAKQEALIGAADIDGYRELDLEFHRSLWALSGNSRIEKAGGSLLDQMRLGNALTASLPGRAATAVTEHLAIAQAIAEQNVRVAGVAAKDHIRHAREAFEETLTSRSVGQ